MKTTIQEEQKTERLWIDVALIIGLGALTLFYLHPLLTMEHIVYGGDAHKMWYPFHVAYAEGLRRGALLLWAPEMQIGFPLFAEGQMGGLYPVNLILYRVLPVPVAYNYNLVFHVLLAEIFTFLFARSLGLRGLAALLPALTYTVSTQLTILQWVMDPQVTAWLPVLLYCLELGYQRKRAIYFIVAGMVIGVQFLVFFPQLSILLLSTACSYGAFRLFIDYRQHRQTRELVTRGLETIGAFGLGAGLGAVQILPTWELVGFSIRAGGVSTAFGGEGSLPPWGLLGLISPSWNFNWTGTNGVGYLGLLPLILAIVALKAWRKDWRVTFFAVLGVVSLVLAMGRYSPLYWLLRQVPGFNYFRLPFRFAYLSRFGLAMLSGVGILYIEKVEANKLAKGLVAFAALAAVLMALGSAVLRLSKDRIIALGENYALTRVYGTEYHVQSADYYRQKVASIFSILQRGISLANPQVITTLSLLLLIGGMFFLWHKGHLNRRALAVLGSLLLMGDFLFYMGPSASETPFSTLHTPETVPFLTQNSGLARIYSLNDQRIIPGRGSESDLPENSNLAYGIASVGIYSSLGMRRHYELLKDLGTVSLGFGVAPTEEATLYRRLPTLSLLGVRYVLATHLLNDDRLHLVYDGATKIYENTTVLPRAFVVPDYTVAANAHEALTRVTAQDFDPMTHVVLEEHPTSQAKGFVGSQARIVRYEDQHVVIETDGGGWLVLSDTYYPGWRVLVDGAEGRVYRANYVMRAVPLAAGRHRVEFTYRPDSFRLGAAITALALAGLSLWALVASLWTRD